MRVKDIIKYNVTDMLRLITSCLMASLKTLNCGKYKLQQYCCLFLKVEK